MNKLLQTAIFITFCLILLTAQSSIGDEIGIPLQEGINITSICTSSEHFGHVGR